jgi:hypothetical protein
MSAEAPAVPTVERHVRCGSCRRRFPCSPTDQLRYAKEGWPRCCGEVMMLDPAPGAASQKDNRLGRRRPANPHFSPRLVGRVLGSELVCWPAGGGVWDRASGVNRGWTARIEPPSRPRCGSDRSDYGRRARSGFRTTVIRCSDRGRRVYPVGTAAGCGPRHCRRLAHTRANRSRNG